MLIVRATGVATDAAKISETLKDRAVAKRREYTDTELEEMWANWGGSFHGPNVEHGTMPKRNLIKLLRAITRRDIPKPETDRP